MSENDRLLGLRAIVTGANAGIGDAITRLFAQHQAQVLAVDLPGSGIETRFDSVSGVKGFAADVADADAAQTIIAEATEAQGGGLDILVNNAGICLRGSVEDTSDEDWERSFNVNVSAIFRLCKAALPALEHSPAGRIINVGSVMSALGAAERSAYVASKHAVAGLTKSIASEWGRFGITANCLLPGAIMTDMTREVFRENKDLRDYWINKSASKRLGEPLDVARVALFLASDDAVFVSGQGIVVDGGAVHAV